MIRMQNTTLDALTLRGKGGNKGRDEKNELVEKISSNELFILKGYN